MDAKEVLTDYKGVFVERGCLFVSTTGKLLTGYVNCEVIYPYFDIVDDLVAQMIAPFLPDVQGFVCPSTGDIVLAQYATIQANRMFGPDRRIVAVWADKEDGNQYRISRNNFPRAIRGKRVVVLNDRISQGGTTKKVIAEARRLNCDVLGVATLAGVTAATPEMLDVPKVHALSTIDVESFPDDQIPEQYRGWPIAIDEPLGHGSEYIKTHSDYPGGFIELL